MPVVPAAGYDTGPAAPPQIDPRLPVDDFLRIDARPEAFGGAVGTALTRAGGELEKGAGELAQAAISRQGFINEKAADDASTTYMKESHKLLYGDQEAGTNPVTGKLNKPGFYALEGQDAVNAGSPSDALDRLQQSISGSLPNDQARLKFNTETRRLRTFTDAQVYDYYNKQLKAAGVDTLTAKGDLYDREVATAYNDPAKFAQILELAQQDITKKLQIEKGTNADPAILADGRAQELAKLYGSAYRAAIADGQLERAGALKNEAVTRGIWTGQQAEEAQQLIQPHLDRQIGVGVGRGVFGGGAAGGGGGPIPSAPLAPAEYKPLVDKAAAQYNVPPELLTRMLSAENNFKPTGRSSAGAEGIAQFIPATAKQYGVDVNDPESSILGAAHYLADLKAQTGSWHAALKAYLGGEPMNDRSYTTKGVWQYADQLDKGGGAATGPPTPLVPPSETTGPPAGASIPPQAVVFPSNNQIEVWGDSLGDGLNDLLRTSGHTRSGAPTGDIMREIKIQPETHWAGKTVVLSSGSNGPKMSEVRETIEYLQAHQANVVLVGYGTKGQLPQRNAELHQMAGEFKVPIVNAESLGSDGVHPTTRGYDSMAAKIRSIHTQLAASTPAPDTGKPETVPEGTIIYGPNGQQMKNVGGKLVDVTPRTPPPEM